MMTRRGGTVRYGMTKGRGGRARGDPLMHGTLLVRAGGTNLNAYFFSFFFICEYLRITGFTLFHPLLYYYSQSL